MVTYPISVRRNPYRGSNAGKRSKAQEDNRNASLLEDHINKLLRAQASPVQQYSYQRIARETGIEEGVVRALCFSIDCGHNGFTAYRQDLSLQQAGDTLHAGS
jgi:hypothetical protein